MIKYVVIYEQSVHACMFWLFIDLSLSVLDILLEENGVIFC